MVKESHETTLAYLKSPLFYMAHQLCKSFEIKLDDTASASDPNRTKRAKFYHEIQQCVNERDADDIKVSI